MGFILTKLGLNLSALLLLEGSSPTAWPPSFVAIHRSVEEIRSESNTIVHRSTENRSEILLALANQSDPPPSQGASEFSFRQPEQPDHYILQGHVFPNLVEVEAFTVHLWAHGMDAVQDVFEGTATLQVTGTLGHPFESSVRDIEVRYVLIPQKRLEATWKRLTASPLQLTDTELKQSLPRPWLNWGRAALKDNNLAPSERQDLRLSTEYQEMVVRPDDLPAYLATLDGYTLEKPTASDIQRIILYGGVIDLFAIVQWIEESEASPGQFEVEDRRRLMEAIRARLMAMRAPPGLGDHMRLHAMFVLIQALATPENLEFLLSMNSSVEALLQSAGLSFHDALDDENRIELPIHKIREVPSLVQYMDAYKRAMEDIRRVSIPRLLELAYDPLDFRQAPANLGPSPSRVQSQARGLLEPLIPTSVGTVLGAVEDNVEAQKQILEYYIRVRHAPAIVPIMRWLQANPDEVENIGISAAQQLGSSAVPTLMRYYIDNLDQRQRKHARAMLLALPESAGVQVTRAIRSSGIMLRSDATVQQALEAYEEREQAEKQRKAKELSEQAFKDKKDAKSLSARLRAIIRLKEVEPEKLEERSHEIIDVLGLIAKTFDQSSPLESAQALDLLQQLPFGEAKQAAMDTLALVQAEIALAHEQSDEALTILVEHDPELSHEEIRELFSATIREDIQSGIVQGKYPKVHRLLRLADEHFPEDPELVKQREDLFIAQYWPALILAGMFSSTFTATLFWFGFRALARMLKRWKQKRVEDRQKKADGSNARANDEISSDASAIAEDSELDESIGADATRLAFDDESAGTVRSEASVGEPTSEDDKIEAASDELDSDGDSQEAASAPAVPYDEVGDDELLDDGDVGEENSESSLSSDLEPSENDTSQAANEDGIVVESEIEKSSADNDVDDDVNEALRNVNVEEGGPEANLEPESEAEAPSSTEAPLNKELEFESEAAKAPLEPESEVEAPSVEAPLKEELEVEGEVTEAPLDDDVVAKSDPTTEPMDAKLEVEADSSEVSSTENPELDGDMPQDQGGPEERGDSKELGDESSNVTGSDMKQSASGMVAEKVDSAETLELGNAQSTTSTENAVNDDAYSRPAQNESEGSSSLGVEEQKSAIYDESELESSGAYDEEDISSIADMIADELEFQLGSEASNGAEGSSENAGEQAAANDALGTEESKKLGN